VRTSDASNEKEVWFGREKEARYIAGSQLVSHGIQEEWEIVV
jgi:hypothetical protein